MVIPSLLSLSDLCGIRLAYLMWTRRDVASQCWEKELVNKLEKDVLTDIESLPPPNKSMALKPLYPQTAYLRKKLQYRVLRYTRPAGERLMSFLSSWLSKLPPKTPQKRQIGYMLFDCLVLNTDGLINQRETAKNLLRNKMLHNTFAFRLACINFLEDEVLKLWFLVKDYFLNKIILEGNRANLSLEYSNRNELLQRWLEVLLPIVGSNQRSVARPSVPCTEESEEVLFWIGYCLSKENEIDIKEVPHFKGNDVDWHRSLFQSAALSGNVACFDYFKNFCKIKFECGHVDMIKSIFNTGEGQGDQSVFIFHFMLLNFEEKAKLFQEFPINTVFQFLQWPLSQTFLENTKGVWNLIPNEKKDWAFKKLSEFLVMENILLNPFDADMIPLTDDDIYTCTVPYCVDHILKIWIDLWKISPDSSRTRFLDTYVLSEYEYEDLDDYSEGYVEDLPGKFEASGLKQKLLSLFLSSGETLFELHEGEDMKESLRNLVAKYMPEDFEDIDRKFISLLKTSYLHYGGMPEKKEVKKLSPQVLRHPRNCINQYFLNYIKRQTNFVFIL